MTYMNDGKQFLIIAAGGTSPMLDNQGDALIAFALPD